MAELYIMNDEQKEIWEQWVKERPPIIQDLCARFQPNRLYRLKSTRRLVIPISFTEEEDGTATITVIVPQSLNSLGLIPSRRVFGIKPDSVEEVDLPEGLPVLPFERYQDLLDSPIFYRSAISHS